MKKYALLLLLILFGMSTTTWGYGGLKVEVTPSPPECGEPVSVKITGSLRGMCTVDTEKTKVCSGGRLIVVNLCLNCTCTDGCTEIPEQMVEVLGGDQARCGPYLVLLKLWVTYDECCWPWCRLRRPLCCIAGFTSFKICCPDCNCYPCRCWCRRPCPDNDR